MKANGMVVSASFIDKDANANIITNATELTAALSDASEGDVLTLIASDGVNLSSVTINKKVTVVLTHNGSGTIDLNGLVINHNDVTLDLDSSINNTITTPISITGDNVVINGNGATLTGTNPINVTGGNSSLNNITINKTGGVGGSSYHEGNLFNQIGKFSVADVNGEKFKNSAITLGSGVDLTLENVTIGAGFIAAIYSFGDNQTGNSTNDVTIKKCSISAGKYKGIYLGNVGTLDIEDSTFDGTNVKASEATGTTLTDDQKQAGSIIDINQYNLNGATLTIKNNKFNNMQDSGSNAAALKIRTFKSSETVYGKFTSVTVSGNTFSNNIRDIVIGNSGVSTSVNFGTTSVEDDCNLYDYSGVGTLTSYIFEDGQMYGYTAEDTGKKTKIIVDGVKFAAGDGSATHPLEISNVDEFNLLSTISNKMADGDNVLNSWNYKLTTNIAATTDNKINRIYNFSGTLDGNNKTLTISQDTFASSEKDLIENLTGNVLFKNLKVNTTNIIFSSFSDWVGAAKRNAYTTEFNNVDISGSLTAGTNESPYIVESNANNLKFIDCDCSVNISNNYYSGVFIGGYVTQHTSLIYFNNCTYSGTFTGVNCGMLIGNPTLLNNMYRNGNLSASSITVINCQNKGTITGTSTSDLLCGMVNTSSNLITVNSIKQRIGDNLKNGIGGSNEVVQDQNNYVSVSIADNKASISVTGDKIASVTTTLSFYAHGENGETMYTVFNAINKTTANVGDISYDVHQVKQFDAGNNGEINDDDGVYYVYRGETSANVTYSLSEPTTLTVNVYGYDSSSNLISYAKTLLE